MAAVKRKKAIAGYFSANDLDTLKKQYRDRAKKLHPDRGGDEEKFKAMQAEYEAMEDFILRQKFTRKEDFDREIEISEAYKAIVEFLLNYPKLEFEIIGTWIWVWGDTYPIKEVLKEIGFEYAGSKKKWYYVVGEKGPKQRGSGLSLDQIRAKYGSKGSFKSGEGRKKLEGIGSIGKFRNKKLTKAMIKAQFTRLFKALKRRK